MQNDQARQPVRMNARLPNVVPTPFALQNPMAFPRQRLTCGDPCLVRRKPNPCASLPSLPAITICFFRRRVKPVARALGCTAFSPQNVKRADSTMCRARELDTSIAGFVEGLEIVEQIDPIAFIRNVQLRSTRN